MNYSNIEDQKMETKFFNIDMDEEIEWIPYDMLVAYLKGHLSSREIKIVNNYLENNPDEYSILDDIREEIIYFENKSKSNSQFSLTKTINFKNMASITSISAAAVIAFFIIIDTIKESKNSDQPHSEVEQVEQAPLNEIKIVEHKSLKANSKRDSGLVELLKPKTQINDPQDYLNAQEDSFSLKRHEDANGKNRRGFIGVIARI